jgi:glucose uptake protein GlcU
MFESPKFLRNVLFADAASCLATGALQVLFTQSLAQLLNLPALLLQSTGIFLLAYAAVVMVVATREAIPRSLVWVFVAGNFAWAIGCVAMLVDHVVAPTALGEAWILAQAATVVVLAELQWTGLRRTRPIGWA